MSDEELGERVNEAPNSNEEDEEYPTSREDDDTSDEDKEGESGIVFFFSNDNTIHQILNLASSPITPGPTAADSVKRMEAFLRDGILSITGGLATPLVLVKGNPFLRAYHHLRASELYRFLNFLTQKEEWAHECLQHSLSAGTFFTISSDGVPGDCIMVQINAGPFRA